MEAERSEEGPDVVAHRGELAHGIPDIAVADRALEARQALWAKVANPGRAARRPLGLGHGGAPQA